jgi:hypothetical protein
MNFGYGGPFRPGYPPLNDDEEENPISNSPHGKKNIVIRIIGALFFWIGACFLAWIVYTGLTSGGAYNAPPLSALDLIIGVVGLVLMLIGTAFYCASL